MSETSALDVDPHGVLDVMRVIVLPSNDDVVPDASDHLQFTIDDRAEITCTQFLPDLATAPVTGAQSWTGNTYLADHVVRKRLG
ncbi:hypothetical protein O4214_15060 [Rhodococcus erythropolis]|uniref:hypothetical protein n=1 Tax=Rhodococcus erythropolis TaxID=1833 RepID=UPI001E4319EB|nr:MULTISPECIES: hypothetical protein [Rhodococcus erythropolis group]MCD2104569.1 hypothetical protein [Rhodococcus qingshengii]MCZ4525307.1 hypothetical protein [Rhodococcus erythropolis]